MNQHRQNSYFAQGEYSQKVCAKFRLMEATLRVISDARRAFFTDRVRLNNPPHPLVELISIKHP